MTQKLTGLQKLLGPKFHPGAPPEPAPPLAEIEAALAGCPEETEPLEDMSIVDDSPGLVRDHGVWRPIGGESLGAQNPVEAVGKEARTRLRGRLD